MQNSATGGAPSIKGIFRELSKRLSFHILAFDITPHGHKGYDYRIPAALADNDGSDPPPQGFKALCATITPIVRKCAFVCMEERIPPLHVTSGVPTLYAGFGSDPER